MTTVGTKEDNHQSAEITQSDIKSHESINCIAKDELLISIENRGYDTSKKTPIDRVPILLRMNESFRNCFDPLVVSIGPYHFGKPHLKEFEQLKFPIAQKFCRTHGDQLSIEQLYDEVKKVGAIKCYAEVSNEYYEDEMFNRIMFRDALFVLRVMFMFSPHEDHEVQKAVDEDHEVQKAADERLAKSYYFVLRDLFLLENQIPLVVLKVLMELMFKDQGEKTVLLVDGFIEKIYPLLTMQSLEKVTGCCSKSAPKMEAESQCMQKSEWFIFSVEVAF
ncbi:unnamed protein product [Fraxinus pennsylvanica]|uniref:Uncharacterized protein n=1 Tax=Fraxinus pennsylvanica TaxID=56036 RepID=A0AAD2E6W6_9LAMI|nr:unnamed protein product [Fraxinus pennsylvanica]